MKKFLIKVNNVSYEVEVEEVGGMTLPSAPVYAAPVAVQAAPVVQATPAAPAPQPKASAPAGANTIKAPMPGNILSVKVTAGQIIKKGDILLILEAMKMENEIMAPSDGTVAAVHVTKGSTVNTGDAMISLN